MHDHDLASMHGGQAATILADLRVRLRRLSHGHGRAKAERQIQGVTLLAYLSARSAGHYGNRALGPVSSWIHWLPRPYNEAVLVDGIDPEGQPVRLSTGKIKHWIGWVRVPRRISQAYESFGRRAWARACQRATQ